MVLSPPCLPQLVYCGRAVFASEGELGSLEFLVQCLGISKEAMKLTAYFIDDNADSARKQKVRHRLFKPCYFFYCGVACPWKTGLLWI